MYTIRTETGLMVMKMSNRQALGYINSAVGHYRSYQAKGSVKKVTAFQLDEDAVLDSSNGEFRIFFWAGYIFVPD